VQRSQPPRSIEAAFEHSVTEQVQKRLFGVLDRPPMVSNVEVWLIPVGGTTEPGVRY
jgi:hypothetical protein